MSDQGNQSPKRAAQAGSPRPPGKRRPPKVRVGVYGATGTTGTEIVRLLELHPFLELTYATSQQYAGQLLSDVEPSASDVRLLAAEDADPGAVDAVLLCLPHGHSATWAARALKACGRVVDLSGDLRLHADAQHKRVYGSPRPAGLIEHTVYGLTELARPRLPGARLVANPGCYPTCAVLGLAPLAAAGHIGGTVIIDAKSGVSGAGRRAHPLSHFCAVTDDVRPYKLGRQHRHVPEIEQTLAALAPTGIAPNLIFIPQVVPVERGMLATMVVPTGGLPLAEAYALYKTSYQREPFVKLLPVGEPARMRAAARTNRAVIGVSDGGDGEHLIITSAIDNLGKGAAGQAIQNLNAMLGLPEALGLLPRRNLTPVGLWARAESPKTQEAQQ